MDVITQWCYFCLTDMTGHREEGSEKKEPQSKVSCQCSSRNSDICKWPLILTLPLKRAEDYGEMEKPNLETEHGAVER